MKDEKYLMSFEQMIQLVDYQREEIMGLQVMNYNFPASDLGCDGQSVVLSNELFEKLVGTWWEVELSAQRKKALKGIYLGDSVQDALRRRPGIDTSYWCDPSGSTADFLSEISRWAEDECYVD